MNTKYTVNEDQASGLKAGTVVKMYNGYTYGLDSDDTLDTGIPHVCVIEDGASQFYTCALADLVAIDE